MLTKQQIQNYIDLDIVESQEDIIQMVYNQGRQDAMASLLKSLEEYVKLGHKNIDPNNKANIEAYIRNKETLISLCRIQGLK
jgi:Spy/CpxP family protein refolding chaperone